MRRRKAMIVIVMGVSGSGKTTIGSLLARDLGWPFVDADDLHSPENIQRMAAGRPLSDADRQPWLARLGALIARHLFRREDLVLACSALKEAHRRQLAGSSPEVRFVHLKGDRGLIGQRLRQRSGHFAKEALVASQYAALEEPRDAVTINIDERPELQVQHIRDALRLRRKSRSAS